MVRRAIHPQLARPAPELAPRLIGWELAANGVRARITETEAYQGEEDLACHASRGRTARTATLYGAPGTLYVYLCYGMHWMLNIVCDDVDVPAAVLVRSVEVIAGHELAARRRGSAAPAPGAHAWLRLANGPGKVCQALGLDRELHGTALGSSSALRLTPPTRPPAALKNGARVGVGYAGPRWSQMRWRWWEAGFPVAKG